MQPITLKTDTFTLYRIIDVVTHNGDPDALLLTARKVCEDLLRNNVDLLKQNNTHESPELIGGQNEA